MTNRNRELVPDNWSLVRERALTTRPIYIDHMCMGACLRACVRTRARACVCICVQLPSFFFTYVYICTVYVAAHGLAVRYILFNNDFVAHS